MKFATWLKGVCYLGEMKFAGGNLSLLPGGNKVCYLGKKKFVTGIKLSLLPGERGGQSVFIQHLHSSSQEKSVLQELNKEEFFLD